MTAVIAPFGPLSTRDERQRELVRCAASPLYFILNYCQIYDAPAKDWIPFDLWPAQREVVQLMRRHQLLIFLKARQNGLSWIALAFALWLMLFRPIAEVLVFSRREDEAIYLLSDERLRGMYKRLPRWMQAQSIVTDDKKHLRLSNGSGARAFPSNAGDSYTATFAIIDEADLVPDLETLMGKVKPTIDAGGKLVLISRVDKSTPQSYFKNVYKAARAGENGYASMFLPWYVHPGRDEAWYEAQKRDAMKNAGSLDSVFEQYPSTDMEALAERTLDKRIAPEWLAACFEENAEIVLGDAVPAIPGLVVYRTPEPGRVYAIGVDPAEGNPTSDDSAITVIACDTGEEVAMLSGKFQPAVTAAHADRLGTWYNRAGVMVERNNHGHAVLLWLSDHSTLTRLPGFDKREGWHSTSQGKALLYDATSDAFREQTTRVRSYKTFYQLQSIEGSTLRAPVGLMDDCADSFALALVGRRATELSMRFYSGVW